MDNAEKKALMAALEWTLEAGANELLDDMPVDSTKKPEKASSVPPEALAEPLLVPHTEMPPSKPPPLGASEAKEKAIKLAQEANSLQDLQDALAGFDGLAVKKTATNLVFCDGNPEAPIMLIGEAPGTDEDKQGKPFVGASGQLLDRILACIDIKRHSGIPFSSIYISNILNWRPPGNRTPTVGEIEVARPFIEKHIALIKPRIIILCGKITAVTLLNSDESMGKLRNKWHQYTPETPGIVPDGTSPIPAIATYHPAYLLRTPSQKRAVWQDILMLQEKREELGLLPENNI